MDNTSSGGLPNIICYAGNVTYSCFDDDLNTTHVTPQRWTTIDKQSGLTTAIVLLIFMLIGLPCNLFIVVSMLWKKLYRQPAHILLLNLALNEFLMCATYIPINVVSGFAGEFIFGTNDVMRCHVCQTGVIFIIFTNFNLHILAFLSLDRFLFFRYPLHYKKWVTIKSTIVAVVLLWIFCIVISLPPLFGFGEIRFTQSISTCSIYLLDTSGVTDNIFYEVFAILESFVFPITLLVVTSVGMVTIVCRQLKKTYGSYNLEAMGGVDKEAELRMRRRKSKKKLQVVKVYGAILLSNLFTWSPNVLNIAVIFALCERPVRIPHQFFISNYLFFTASVVIHPILQACLIPDIRKTLTAPCTKKKNQPPPLSMEFSRTSFFSIGKGSILKRGKSSKSVKENGVNGLERGTSSSGVLNSKSKLSVCACCMRQPQEQPSASNHLALNGSSPVPAIHGELTSYNSGLPSPTQSVRNATPESPMPNESA